jgi:hypothetical protein
MQGTGTVEVGDGPGGIAAVRAALARAVASGALGPGYAVRRDGDGLVFDGSRSRGADGGRIDVAGDGRVTWTLRMGGSERARALESVAWAALASIAGAILFNWFFFVALPVGGAVGIVYAATAISAERAAARRRVTALLASLPVLVDASSQ